jgi:hypothetical protein
MHYIDSKGIIKENTFDRMKLTFGQEEKRRTNMPENPNQTKMECVCLVTIIVALAIFAAAPVYAADLPMI